MKKVLRTLLAGLLVMLMLFSVVTPLTALAEDSADGDTSAALEDLSFSGDPDVSDNQGELGFEPEEQDEAPADTGVIDAEQIIDRTPIESGDIDSPSIEGETPDESGEEIDESEADLEQEPVEDDADTESPVVDMVQDDDSLNASAASVRASSSSLSVMVGSSVTISVTGRSVYSSVYFSVSYNSSNVSCRWGSVSGGRVPLTITGKKATGSSTTPVYISIVRAADRKVLATTTVYVTVKNTVTLTSSKSIVTVAPNDTASFTLSVAGAVSGMKLSATKSNSKITATLAQQSGMKYTVNVKGVSTGSSVLKFYIKDAAGRVYAQTSVTVYIVQNASISFSNSSLSVGIGSTVRNTVTLNNFSGAGKVAFSINNSNCTASWEGGWSNNSIKLAVVGRKGGTSRITVYLYSSDNRQIASASFNVTIAENARVTSSVSTLNLQTGASSKITFAASGVDTEFYLNASVSPSGIADFKWNTNWNPDGTSIGMTVTAKSAGVATLTVKAIEKGTNRQLASVNVTVKVTGSPSVGFSVSSVSCKVGDQQTVKVTASGYSGSYKLSYSVSGSAATCAWTSSIVNNSANLLVKGAASGSATVTVKMLRSSDNAVLASRSLSVNVSPQQTPSLSVSTSNLYVQEGDTETMSISWAGLGNTDAKITVSYNSSIINVAFGSVSGSSCPVNVTGRAGGSSTMTFKLVRKSDSYVLASQSVKVEVDLNSNEVRDLSYYFENYPTSVEQSTFRLGFKNNTLADSLYRAYSSAGGVCYGMAATSLLFNNNTLSLSSYGKDSVNRLAKTDYSSTYGLNAKRLIELMYISQFSTGSTFKTSLQSLCNLIDNGNLAMVCIWGPNGGHALVGYRLDKTNNRLYVYDCNYPYTSSDPSSSIRYITLGKNSSGTYTTWSYTLWAGETWNSSNGAIKYQEMSTMVNLWSTRGSWNSTRVNTAANYLITTAESFTLYDYKNEPVATYENGVLQTENEEIYKIELTQYHPDGGAANPYDIFVLPVDYYVMENNNEGESVYAEMINSVYGAKVQTNASVISFAVDDSLDFCSANIELETGDSYSISLMNSNAPDEEYEFDGFAQQDGGLINCSLMNTTLSYSVERATLSINGALEATYKINATAGEGGTISPAGESLVAEGTDVTYTITPDEGYEIADVFVNDESVGALDNYTFFEVEADAEIYATFVRAEDEAEDEREPGDVDGDGKISSIDARNALRFAVGLDPVEEGSAEFIAADVNEDGSITSVDARAILRAAVGLTMFD